MTQQQEPAGYNPAGSYETWVEINLDNLTHNIRVFRELLGKAEIIAILKGNAYGLHAPTIYRHLAEIGVRYFGVANIREAMQLRNINAGPSILVLGNVHPRFIPKAIEQKLSLTVFSPEFWQILKRLLTAPIGVHIKLNTGFNRLGFSCDKESVAVIKEICSHPMIRIEGIYTHLALGTQEDDRAQFDLFKSTIAMLEAEGLSFPLKHIAESNAAVAYPWSRMDAIRAGSAMYGFKTSYPGYKELDLRGVYKFKSSVAQVRNVKKGEGISYEYAYRAPRDMRTATISFSYGDGYHRGIKSGNAFVMIRGQKATLVGSMCMDSCMADVTDIPGVEINDEVLIYDSDSTSPLAPPVVAGFAGFSKDTSLNSITNRVARVYIKGGKRFGLDPLNGTVEEL